jgi:curved DNA-binding protein CbpA
MLEKHSFILAKRGSACLQAANLHTTSGCCQKCCYETLGVAKNASQLEIKTAYYARSKLLHPDGSGSAEAFKELKEAYDVLRRPADRRLYDMGVRSPHGHRSYRSASAGASRTGRSWHGHSTYDYAGQDWRTFWQNHYENKQNSSTEDIKTRERLQWRRIVRYTAFGLIAVTAYNVGYFRRMRQDRIDTANLIAKDEVARSFLRQREHRSKMNDKLEVEAYAKLLREDIDQAQKLRLEQMVRNPFEIREEERWMAAIRRPKLSEMAPSSQPPSPM